MDGTRGKVSVDVTKNKSYVAISKREYRTKEESKDDVSYRPSESAKSEKVTSKLKKKSA